MHLYLDVNYISFHPNDLKRWVRFIFNTLIIRRRPKISRNNTTFYQTGSFGEESITIKLKSSIHLFEYSYTIFCRFLWSIWRGETISDLFLDLLLESVPMLLIGGNHTYLGMIFNAILLFWLVAKIWSNKSSWIKICSWYDEVSSVWSGLPLKAYPYLFKNEYLCD